MPLENRDPALLWDMLQAARAVMQFVHGKTFTEYDADLLLSSGVERQLEIIGEAARGVSKTFRAEHAEIPWKAIVAQRHILSHDYGDIDNAKVWRVATDYVPELVGQLESFVPTDTDD